MNSSVTSSASDGPPPGSAGASQFTPKSWRLIVVSTSSATRVPACVSEGPMSVPFAVIGFVVSRIVRSPSIGHVAAGPP